MEIIKCKKFDLKNICCVDVKTTCVKLDALLQRCHFIVMSFHPTDLFLPGRS